MPAGPVARFAPPVLWMGVIAVLSGGVFAADETGSWLLPLLAHWLPGASPRLLHALHAAIRKLGHLTEYGVLAALWVRALDGRPRAEVWAIALSVAYAALDEARQGLAPTRSPSVLDVAVDAAGALVAVACLRPRTRAGAGGLRVLRWGAITLAVLSVGTALLDWRLGLTAWDLGVVTLGATATAFALRRLERAWRAPT